MVSVDLHVDDLQVHAQRGEALPDGFSVVEEESKSSGAAGLGFDSKVREFANHCERHAGGAQVIRNETRCSSTAPYLR